MNTLCIVPCGRAKIWDKNQDAGPTAAKDVYIGTFAKMCKEYAETFYPSSWCILSAKYGFLFPDDIVPGPYNVSFINKSTNPIKLDELKKQAAGKRLNQYLTIVAVGGKGYVKIIRDGFPNKKVIAPLSGCKGIAYMLRELRKAIDRNIMLKEAKI